MRQSNGRVTAARQRCIRDEILIEFLENQKCHSDAADDAAIKLADPATAKLVE